MSLKRLQLLGWPCFVLDAREVPLSASRPMQLLAHLAVGGSWQSRDSLARLFWPDRSDKIARSNLRNLLCKTVAAAPFAPIESTQHAIRLKAPSDLDDLEAVVQRSDWEAVVRIGAGDLLQGFDIDPTEPYLQWLRSERAARLAQWKKAVQALLAQTSKPIEHREALAESWALRCPDDEDAVQARMALAFERGQDSAAARIFRAFEARLQHEFGVRPSRELERYALQAPHGPEPGKTPAQAYAQDFQTTRSTERPRIFGRRLELGQLNSLLADDTVRLITLTGPGGVGKSTLLAAVHAQWVEAGRTEARLVDASMAQNAQAVIVAMAAVLGIEELQGASNEAALASTLHDKRLLLMIDGAEQAGLAGPLALLLERCPQTRLLVASRQRLQLDSERVLALDGFPLPDAEETDAEVLGTNDAVGYFTAIMRHAGRPADLARDASNLAALVRAVDGLPLALKLLAQLTHLFSLQQLLDSVRQHVAGTQAVDFPALGELMPALVASFDRSWMALSPAQQAVLARLAVFPAAFDITAARSIAGTELPVITSLVDSSLVRPTGAGRLSLHGAIRACVLAVCPIPDSAHADYLEHYRRRLGALAGVARSKSVRPLRQFLRDEGAHVEHAWQLALQRRALPTLLSLAESLWFLNDGISGGVDCVAGLVEAEGLLRDDQTVTPALRAMLLAGAARAAQYHGHFDLAVERAKDAMRIAQRARHRDALIYASDSLIKVYLNQRKLREAEALVHRVVALHNQPDGQASFPPNVLSHQRLLCFLRSDFETNLRLADQMMTIFRRFEDSDAEVRLLMSKAFVCAESGDLPRAIQGLEQAVQVAAANDASPALQATALCLSATWHLEGGHVARARPCIERANAIAFSYPQSQWVRLYAGLANAAFGVATQDIEPAAQQLTEALAAMSRSEELTLAEPIFLVTAKWFLLLKEREAGVTMLRAIGAQVWEMRTFAAAQAMLRELGEQPQPPTGTEPQRPVVDVAEAATIAGRRVLQLLEQRRRSNRPA